MRVLCVLVWIGSALAALSTASGQDFPHTAYVSVDEVYVRSGPGRNYYPTEKLRKGDRVEVYRHDPGGWFAIRPPQDSFSWVSSRYIKRQEDGLGEVTDDKVVARVGSKFSSVRDVIQVRLQRGEVVEIVGEQNNGGQTWYKITSPSGEFRWISRRHLQSDPPKKGLNQPLSQLTRRAKRPERSNRPNKRAWLNRRSNDADAADEKEVEARIDTSTLDAEASRGIDDVLDEDRDHAIAHDLDHDIDTDIAGADESEGRRPPPSRIKTWRPDRTLGQDRRRGAKRSVNRDSTVQQAAHRVRIAREAIRRPMLRARERVRLNDIQHELSIMVAEEPSVWEFSELKHKAEKLMKTSGTAVERGRVRKVLDRIARFEDIKQRHARIRDVQSDTDHANHLLDAASGANRSKPLQRDRAFEAKNKNFDGVGTVRPVISRRRNAPKYALVDKSGEVALFITPSPGVNLQPFLGQNVGVRGTRGYLSEYNTKHVMVQRITSLDERRLR